MTNRTKLEKRSKSPLGDLQMGEERYDDYYEEGISLKELLLVLIKGKKTIAFITVVLVIAAFLGSVIAPNIEIGSKGEVQAAVQLYFSGIDQGENPDGSVFDVNEIKSAEVLEHALDNVKLSGNPSVTTLAGCISFEAVLPDDAVQVLKNISDLKTEQLKLERLEKLEVHPTSYIIRLNVSDRLGITLEEGRELLDNVVLEYKRWLIDQYSGYEVLPNLFNGELDLNDYDYIRAADLLSGQLHAMSNYVDKHLKNNSFHSTSTGMGADDIRNSLESMMQVQVEQLYSLIGAFYITKDASRIVAVYENLGDEKERQGAASQEKAAALNQILANFKASEQTLLSTDSKGDPVTIKMKSQTYDQLASQSIAESSNAADSKVDASYYRAEAKRFAAAPQTVGPESLVGSEAEKIISDLGTRLNQWNKTINQTVKEYYDQEMYQQYVEQLIPANHYDMGSSVNIPLNMAIALVLGFVIGVLVILFREYLKPDMIKEKEESNCE